MITRIEIAGLRGVHEATLDPLTMLTVIVGPSGGGKSTVLEAIFLAASRDLAGAVAKVATRRRELVAGVTWLLPWASAAPNASARVTIHDEHGERELTLSRRDHGDRVGLEVAVASNVYGALASAVVEFPEKGMAAARTTTETRATAMDRVPAVHFVQLAEGARQEVSLVERYSQVVRDLGFEAVDALVAHVRPGASGLRVLVEGGGVPVLCMAVPGHVLPVAALGGGIHALVRLALDLAAAAPGSVVLLEDPEAHQHPEVIYRAARLLLATVKRGAQVILTTHSLELIDALVVLEKEDARKLEPGSLSVRRVVLDEQGTLLSSYFPDDMVRTARGDLDEDLR